MPPRHPLSIAICFSMSFTLGGVAGWSFRLHALWRRRGSADHYKTTKGCPKANGHQETWENGIHEVIVPSEPIRLVYKYAGVESPARQ